MSDRIFFFVVISSSFVFSPRKDKSRKDESLYHPRLTYVEPEEEEESDADSYDQHPHSDGSYSPRHSRVSSGGSSGEESSPRRRPGPKKLNSLSPSPPHKPERRSERMFDDSDDDSSTEKEGTNLNWTPAEVVTPIPPFATGTARRRSGPPGSKDPVPSTGSGLINLCATVPPVHGTGGAAPAETRTAAAAIIHPTQQGQCVQGRPSDSDQSQLVFKVFLPAPGVSCSRLLIVSFLFNISGNIIPNCFLGPSHINHLHVIHSL